jgi:hypothetical protein
MLTCIKETTACRLTVCEYCNPTEVTLADQACHVLDELLDLYRQAQVNFEACKGKFGETEALYVGKKIFDKYEATKMAYALIGLSNLGIHNNKVGA